MNVETIFLIMRMKILRSYRNPMDRHLVIAGLPNSPNPNTRSTQMSGVSPRFPEFRRTGKS